LGGIGAGSDRSSAAAEELQNRVDLLVGAVSDRRHASHAVQNGASQLRKADARADFDERRRGGRSAAILAVAHRAMLFVRGGAALQGGGIGRSEEASESGIAVFQRDQLVEGREVLIEKIQDAAGRI